MNTDLHIVETSRGEPTFDSNEVSLLLETPHNVLYAHISNLRRGLEAVNIDPHTYFITRTYTDEDGKLESYLITRKGFTLLLNSFTGEKGLIMCAMSAAAIEERFKKLTVKKEGKAE